MGVLSILLQRIRAAFDNRPTTNLGRNSSTAVTMTRAERPPLSVPDSCFFPSFAPFKPTRQNSASVERRQQEEYEEFGDWVTSDTFPFRYGVALDANGEITLRPRERFRSAEEVKWAETFDALGLDWEYEPLKFDMGPNHFSYTPDFRITDLSVPGSSRSLFIETKWFGEEMLLTKYVRFTEWYECDLLVLAYRKRKKTGLAPNFETNG